LSKYALLEDSINYRFDDDALLRRALTHRSFSKNNNERLEFLGDSFLNHVIAAFLFSRFSSASEGDLSRMRSSLVRKETLALIGRGLDLGSFISFGEGEKKSGARNRDSTIADALEGLIGAILLDSSSDIAAQVVIDLFNTKLNDLDEANMLKDAKTRLQEKLQRFGDPPPDYVVVSVMGRSPNEIFEVACFAKGIKHAITGRGSSKRQAEQNAAKNVLEEMEA
tara:strand:- start:47 stop:718 length:672 start_codon:yes stop_codon:yes gene_type:complete